MNRPLDVDYKNSFRLTLAPSFIQICLVIIKQAFFLLFISFGPIETIYFYRCELIIRHLFLSCLFRIKLL